DGIRDFHVTGVQTCALPICPDHRPCRTRHRPPAPHDRRCQPDPRARRRPDRRARHPCRAGRERRDLRADVGGLPGEPRACPPEGGPSVIRRLLHYSSSRARRLVIAELAAISVTAVLQGIAFLMLVPLLRAVFVGDMDSVRTWLVAIAVVGAAYAMGYWTASQIGMKASTAVLDSLLDRLGKIGRAHV